MIILLANLEIFCDKSNWRRKINAELFMQTHKSNISRLNMFSVPHLTVTVNRCLINNYYFNLTCSVDNHLAQLRTNRLIWDFSGKIYNIYSLVLVNKLSGSNCLKGIFTNYLNNSLQVNCHKSYLSRLNVSL